MRPARLSLNFKRLPDAELLTRATFILNSMTNNPHFTDPVPTLAQLDAAIQAYNSALIGAANLGLIRVAEKNSYRQALIEILVQLGMYVSYIANGNAVILTSTGFPFAKEPQPVHLERPEGVIIKNGITSGQLIGMVKRVKGVTSYLHQIATEPPVDESVWKSNPSTKSKHLYKDLLPGRQYWIRIVALGSGEQVAYSPVATQFAQ